MAADRSLTLANAQYLEGFSDFQRVLDTQRALFAQQDAYLLSRSDAVNSLIALYKALGGGWYSDAAARRSEHARTDAKAHQLGRPARLIPRLEQKASANMSDHGRSDRPLDPAPPPTPADPAPARRLHRRRGDRADAAVVPAGRSLHAVHAAGARAGAHRAGRGRGRGPGHAGAACTTTRRSTAGQDLFEIDPEPFQIAVERARADLEATRRQVGASTAGIDSAVASLRAAEANELQARQDRDRLERLYHDDPGTISLRRLEISRATFEQAVAKVAASEADVQRAREQEGGSSEDNAQLRSATTTLAKAELDLANTRIRARSAGLVTDLRTEVGQFAAAGKPVLTLITVNDVWISAEFTENNLGHVRPGTAVRIVLDALPGRVFDGKVRSIGYGVSVGSETPPGSLPTVQNNRDWLRAAQRFPVIIEFERGPTRRAARPSHRRAGRSDGVPKRRQPAQPARPHVPARHELALVRVLIVDDDELAPILVRAARCASRPVLRWPLLPALVWRCRSRSSRRC